MTEPEPELPTWKWMRGYLAENKVPDEVQTIVLGNIHRMEYDLEMRKKQPDKPVEKINGHDATPLTRAVRDVVNEYKNAVVNYKPFNSAHEGLAVLEEEVFEVKKEVYKKQSERSKDKLKSEARQVAAMGIRFMIDVCDGGRERV